MGDTLLALIKYRTRKIKKFERHVKKLFFEIIEVTRENKTSKTKAIFEKIFTEKQFDLVIEKLISLSNISPSTCLSTTPCMKCGERYGYYIKNSHTYDECITACAKCGKIWNIGNINLNKSSKK